MKRTSLVGIILLVIAIVVIPPVAVFAGSWTSNGSSIYYNSGGVGIGTTSPTTPLEVNGNLKVDGTPGATLIFQIDASMGGTSSNVDPIYVHDNQFGASFYVYMPRINYGSAQPGDTAILNTYGNLILSPSATGKDLKFIPGVFTNSPAMVIEDGGNVGIGKSNPQAKLDVAGKIIAQEIRVTTTAEVNDLKAAGSISANEVKVNDAKWSDFVFEKDYKLPSLDHIESYVKENKHLPDVPSAQDIKKNGLPVADMMAKQMQKIEELTLYMIELKKQNEKLAELNNSSSQEISELKAKIGSLEKKIN